MSKIKLDMKPKGYDLPKQKIPKKLKPAKDIEKKDEGASLWDYMKFGLDKIANIVIGTKEFISDIKIATNTMLYVLIGAIILVVLISVLF